MRALVEDNLHDILDADGYVIFDVQRKIFCSDIKVLPQAHFRVHRCKTLHEQEGALWVQRRALRIDRGLGGGEQQVTDKNSAGGTECGCRPFPASIAMNPSKANMGSGGSATRISMVNEIVVRQC